MNRKRSYCLTLTLALLIPVPGVVFAQSNVEFLGLEDKPITCIGVLGFGSKSLIAVGTDEVGVYYQYGEFLPDSGWILVGLEDKHVSAIYPHYVTVGPMMEWWISAGVFPDEGDSDYVYCSFMGDDFVPNSTGISDSLAEGIFSLAGYSRGESVCGEKYAATGPALYRQLFGDTLWTPVYFEEGSEGSGIIQVKTRDEFGGFVLAGGSVGYTGILLIKSTDFGDTWVHLYPPGEAYAFDFDVDSSSVDFKVVFVSHRDRISRSLNGGETWEIILDGGGWYYFNDIVYDPTTGVVCAAGGDGLDTSSAVLFYSEDLGSNWTQVSLTMSGPIVAMALGWDGCLYFVIPYNGVYRISMDELSTTPDHLPRSFALHQNYPNPFNASTTIAFDLPKEADVQLVIYDLVGREVATLVGGRLASGRHEVVWDASGFPTAIYLVRLETGKLSQARKVVLLK